jgi:DNA-directed RNA polymerase subunit omega
MDTQKDKLVEQCLKIVPDCFMLVVLSAYRARELASGVTPTVPSQGSKGTIVALKEIAEGQVDVNELEERIVTNFQQFAFLSPH